MKILVLGAGCAKCDQMKQTVKDVVKELGIEVDVEHTQDINVVMAYSVLTTPGLVINEEVVCSGKVPTKAEVTQFLINAQDKEKKPSS
ncbi:thioredoxin family protein [Chloroflexota bacterium]